MSTSTAPRDLAAIKHALELGLILATLIIATIMIVAAVHGNARKLRSDITIGQVMFSPAQAMLTWSVRVQPPYVHPARNERKGDMNPLTGKVLRRGTFDGYEVAGWRHSDDASWKVKVWLAGCPRDWFGYTVTAGMFELKMFAHAQREAVLHAIGEWETELVDDSVRNEPFDHSLSHANIHAM